jgi:uncharacterized protein with GYD domain
MKTQGITFLGMLTVAFIVLKLTNHIDWSWVFVILPKIIEAVIRYFQDIEDKENAKRDMLKKMGGGIKW